MLSLTSASTLLPLLVSSVLAAAARRSQTGGVDVVTAEGRQQCTVTAHGGNVSDVANILQAFEICGHGGNIIFPEDQNYFIASKLNPVVHDVNIDWKGIWTFSPDLDYWRNNSYPIAFQNHHASFILTGDHIHISGHGTGGIHGNGEAWYNAETNVTQPGRPMPFVFWNVSDVTVKQFFVKQPPLWSCNIMNGTDMWFDELLCNATASQAPYGVNWVQNTDGFDTMDAQNILLTNFVYQGGDDCIAIKPRSYNIRVQNATCHGGNGIAIGSLGQYLEDSSVANVVVDDVNILTHNADMETSAYIKTWVGALVPQTSYESLYLPRGGGWGTVTNILFSNFVVQGADAGPTITQDSGDNGRYAGTSLMQISNIAFVNFTGWLSGTEGERTADVSCSDVHPCYNIEVQNVSLTVSRNSSDLGMASCEYVALGGVHGLNGTGC